MVSQQLQALDRVFLALGHPVRRQILERLMVSEATVTDIAAPFELSLNAISKHLKVLEKAGLIQRQIQGREHYCRLSPQPLEEVTDWLTHYQTFWTSRFDAMEQELIARERAKSLDKE